MGARIILVARNKSRAEATLARLSRSGPGASHSVYFADLTRLAEMKRVAAEIANREPPIDILINNAGALFGTRRLTEDGLENTFALNHMSYFVVTQGLRERLLASGAARIINTAFAVRPAVRPARRRASIEPRLPMSGAFFRPPMRVTARFACPSFSRSPWRSLPRNPGTRLRVSYHPSRTSEHSSVGAASDHGRRGIHHQMAERTQIQLQAVTHMFFSQAVPVQRSRSARLRLENVRRS